MPQRVSGHSEARIPPERLPTDSGTFRWLTAGLIAGGAAALAASGSLLALGVTLLQHSGSVWCMLAAGAAIGVGIVSRIWKIEISSRAVERFPFLEYGEKRRVEREVASIAKRRGVDIPAVVASDKAQNLAMLDRPGRRNLLLFNPEVTELLDDRELRGTIAHEIQHADRWYSAYRFTSDMLRNAATVAMTWGVGHLVWVANSGDGVISKILPFVVSFAAMIGTSMVCSMTLSLIGNIASRANELRTDVRAIALTGDLEGYTAAFDKLYSKLSSRSSRWLAALHAVSTHPPYRKRMEWLKRACEP